MLSNAVKYSSHGEVTITTTLLPFTGLPRHKSTADIGPISPYLTSRSSKKSDLNLNFSGKGIGLTTGNSTRYLLSSVYTDINHNNNNNRMGTTCEGSGSSGRDNAIGRSDTQESEQNSTNHSTNSGPNSHTNSSTNSSSNRTNTDEKREDEEEDSAGAGEAYLLFEIKDMGIGIAQDVMDALFAPFKQAQRFAGGMTYSIAAVYYIFMCGI